VLSVVMKRIAVALISSCVGLVAGTGIAHSVIAVMNHLATDGPYFPAPLVAFGFVALPIGVLRLVVQTAVVACEVVAWRALGHRLWVIGVPGGLAAGLVWHLVLGILRDRVVDAVGLRRARCRPGAVVFGCHWLASRMVLHGVREAKGPFRRDVIARAERLEGGHRG